MKTFPLLQPLLWPVFVGSVGMWSLLYNWHYNNIALYGELQLQLHHCVLYSINDITP